VSFLLRQIDEDNSCIAVPRKNNVVIASDLTENSTRDEHSERDLVFREILNECRFSCFQSFCNLLNIDFYAWGQRKVMDGTDRDSHN
jgi:hypothetical protein